MDEPWLSKGIIIRYHYKVIAFDRKRSIYVVFPSRGFYEVPRVLIAAARSFQALAAILDYVTHLALMSC